MRGYSKISPMIWLGETGRQLRGDPEAQAMAFYLITCPSSNMLGLYYLPVPTMAHELGWTLEGASKGLQRVCEVGFAQFDSGTDFVWIPNMAGWQILTDFEPLKEKDKRVQGVQNLYDSLQPNVFLEEFFEKYQLLLRLKKRRTWNGQGASKGHGRGMEGACKTHRRDTEAREQRSENSKASVRGTTLLDSSNTTKNPDPDFSDPEIPPDELFDAEEN